MKPQKCHESLHNTCELEQILKLEQILEILLIVVFLHLPLKAWYDCLLLYIKNISTVN
jgi:hypothetical protein